MGRLERTGWSGEKEGGGGWGRGWPCMRWPRLFDKLLLLSLFSARPSRACQDAPTLTIPPPLPVAGLLCLASLRVLNLLCKLVTSIECIAWMLLIDLKNKKKDWIGHPLALHTRFLKPECRRLGSEIRWTGELKIDC